MIQLQVQIHMGHREHVPPPQLIAISSSVKVNFCEARFNTEYCSVFVRCQQPDSVEHAARLVAFSG